MKSKADHGMQITVIILSDPSGFHFYAEKF